jgi:hypothetical protein
MKTPRSAVLIALLALAPAVQAAPVSLAGWTAYKALHVIDANLIIGGAPYADGVIYCDFRQPSPTTLLPSAPTLFPVINCVVIGRAHASAGPKVGGIFASGRAYYQRSTGPVVTMPGGDPRSLLLKITQVPYVDQLVVLTTVIPAAEAPYISYVEAGDHLTSPAAAPGVPPHPPVVTHTYWCDPKDGKITTVPPGHKPVGSHRIAKKTSACVIGQKPPVIPPAPVVSAGPFPLIDVPNHLETRWLTKVQAAAYADERKAATTDPARKTVDDKYRLLVKAQLRPEAAAAYATAYASPVAEAPAKISAAIGSLEMWGGPVAAVVGLFQEKADPATAKLLEIQLSKADWDVLNSSAPAKPEYKAAATAYKNARAGADGQGAGTAFKASVFDPIQLRLSLTAALAALGRTPSSTPPDQAKVPVPNLTPAELALLTPDELTKYIGQLNAAKGPPPNQSALEGVWKMNTDLRAAIAADGRAPFAAPKTPDEFKGLKPWQKAQLCKPSAAAAATTTSPAVTDAGHGALALPDLIALAGRIGSQGGLSSSSPSWMSGACDDFKKEQALTPNPANPGTAPVTTNVPTPNGVDKEAEAKKKNEWLTSDLLTSAAKGAMVGLLVGSLFGPVGLIAGPLLGAALFYGLTKITS